MKKLIRSSVLLLGLFFFAGAAKAQLASDKPAMTAQQVSDLTEKRKADAKITTTPVVNNKTTATTVSSPNTPANVVIVKTEPAKAAIQPATSVSATPATSQGDVKPVTTAPVTQTTEQTPPVQSEKPVAPVKQQ